MRIDTAGLKHRHPLADVVVADGVALRRSGRALAGRCPFHADGDPSLHVYPDGGFTCYGCGAAGDVITWVMLRDRVGFAEACARLVDGTRGGPPGEVSGAHRSRPTSGWRPPRRWARGHGWRPDGPGQRRPVRGTDGLACVQAAGELYAARLAETPAALAYLRERGVDRRLAAQAGLGYAAGGELVAHLRWQRLSLGAAQRAGLVVQGGDGRLRELLAGRLVVPERRGGRAIWLVGRVLPGAVSASAPKYLDLPGPKPLVGLEAAAGGQAVVVVEGPFDWLALVGWGIPAIALVGTAVRPEAVAALRRFPRVYRFCCS